MKTFVLTVLLTVLLVISLGLATATAPPATPEPEEPVTLKAFVALRVCGEVTALQFIGSDGFVVILEGHPEWLNALKVWADMKAANGPAYAVELKPGCIST